MFKSILMATLPTATVCGSLTLAGCGGSGGGGGAASGGFSTSVSGSAILGALSPTQQMQLCSDSVSYLSDTIEAPECKEVGFEVTEELASIDTTDTDSELQSACTSAYSSCLGSIGADGGAGSCDFSELTASNCTATVATLSACLTDIANAVAQEANTVPSCSAITRAGLSSAASIDGGEVTASSLNCAALEQMCPNAVNTSTTLTFARAILRW